MDQAFKQQLLAPIRLKLTRAEIAVIMSGLHEAINVFPELSSDSNYIRRLSAMGGCYQAFAVSKRLFNKTLTTHDVFTVSFNHSEVAMVQCGLEIMMNQSMYNSVATILYGKIHQKTTSIM